MNTHGAELVSLKSIETDREYMWCGDAEYWGRVSPVLFPFVGKLEGQRYRHNGVVYENIPQHGFARDSEFVVGGQTGDTLLFVLEKNDTWQKSYPFDFSLCIGYRLEGSSVHVMWTVVNEGTDTIHFLSVPILHLHVREASAVILWICTQVRTRLNVVF